MQLRVFTDGAGWRVCSDCPDEAAVELELHEEPGRFEPFCLGCLMVKLLWLRALFSTRPAQAAGDYSRKI